VNDGPATAARLAWTTACRCRRVLSARVYYLYRDYRQRPRAGRRPLDGILRDFERRGREALARRPRVAYRVRGPRRGWLLRPPTRASTRSSRSSFRPNAHRTKSCPPLRPSTTRRPPPSSQVTTPGRMPRSRVESFRFPGAVPAACGTSGGSMLGAESFSARYSPYPAQFCLSTTFFPPSYS